MTRRRRHPGRRSSWAVGLTLLVPTVLVLTATALVPLVASSAAADSATCAVPPSQIRVGVSENWNDRFNAFGDANAVLPAWTGGDAVSTTMLPDGRRLWHFGDTFLGAPGAAAATTDWSRSLDAPMISNAVVVEGAGTRILGETLHSGTDLAPRAYVDAGSTLPASWFWPGAGVVEDSKVRLLVSKFHRTGAGAFGFAFDGTAVISLQLPDLTLAVDPSSAPVENRGDVLWDHVLLQPDADYIYGTRDHDLFVAKAPVGRLKDAWTYYTARGGWSSDPSRAAPVIDDGAGTDTQVVQVNHSFVRLSFRGSSSSFSNVIQAYFACSPAGPWTQTGTPIYTTPEGDDDGTIVYSSYIHAETVQGGRMLANYSVNGSGDADYRSTHLYRPHFLRITMTGVP